MHRQVVVEDEDTFHLVLAVLAHVQICGGYGDQVEAQDPPGRDSPSFVLKWYSERPEPDDVRVVGTTNINAFLKSIPDHISLLKHHHGQARLAFVCDSDQNPEGRKNEILEALSSVGVETNSPEGLILGQVRIDVWQMPSTAQAGELESLLWEAVPEGSIAAACVEAVEKAKAHHFRTPTETWPKEDKAKFLSFLALQRRPHMKYGSAIKAGLINPDAEPLAKFKSWLLTALDLPVVQAEAQP